MLSKIRAAIIVVLAAGLVVAAYAGYQLFTEKPVHESSVSRATGTTDDGWQQVTYRGVKLDVPAEWARLDAGECEGQGERWAAAGVDPWGDLGLVFRSSSSFESDAGPGVHNAASSAALPDGG